MLQHLLVKGAQPNITDEFGFTPLQDAATLGHKDVVQLLLEGGADPNMADDIGHAPLHCAAMKGHTYIS